MFRAALVSAQRSDDVGAHPLDGAEFGVGRGQSGLSGTAGPEQPITDDGTDAGRGADGERCEGFDPSRVAFHWPRF